jgi:hypothetical protein
MLGSMLLCSHDINGLMQLMGLKRIYKSIAKAFDMYLRYGYEPDISFERLKRHRH